MGLLVRKIIYLMQKIQKKYSKEIHMYGIIGKENHIIEAKNTENIQGRNWYVFK
jgi:hypothetical protein